MLKRLIAGLLLLWPLAALALDEADLLKPDQAFVISSRSEGNRVVVHWQIADGYYLYQSKFRFDTETPGVTLGTPDLPPGEMKHDPFFGDLEIYRGSLDVPVPVHYQGGKPPEMVELEIRSQGCADAGICFPPHTQTLLAALDNRADQPPPVNPQAAAEAEETLNEATGSPTSDDTPAPEAPSAATPEPIQAPTTTSTPTAPPAAKSTSPLAALGQSLGDALGFGEEDDILSPEQAYQVIPQVVDGNHLRLDFKVTEGTYLYQDKIAVKIDTQGVTPGTLQLPQPEIEPKGIRPDGSVGEVAVYKEDFSVVVPLIRAQKAATEIDMEVQYQGCAERGICYPPQKKNFKLALPATTVTEPTDAQGPAAAPAQASTAPAASQTEELSEQDQIASLLRSSSVWLVMLSFFGLGLLLAFTPCVFPMIPILSGIIAGQKNLTTRRAFVLSLVYVLAMSVTYTIAGVLAGLFGANLQAAFQNPWILSFFALIFVLLALSMFGFYELQLPSSWQSKMSELSNRQQGGQLGGVAIMGLLSALIVGPCVAPPLAGALIFIGQTGDWLLGGLALFAMSLGMGAPLLAIGTSAGRYLPRAGAWMDAVKAVFGVILLGLAITMLERFLDPLIPMLLWGLLLVVSAIYMGALEPLPEGASGWRKLWKGLGVALLIYGALFLVGVAANGRDTLQPLRGLAPAAGPGGAVVADHVSFKRIHNNAELDRELAAARAAGKPVMLDFYADWCIYCKTLEKNVFPDPRVRAVMRDWVLLQVDVTDQTPEQLALQKRFEVPAPPALIFWDAQGREHRNLRIMGEIDAAGLAAHALKVTQ